MSSKSTEQTVKFNSEKSWCRCSQNNQIESGYQTKTAQFVWHYHVKLQSIGSVEASIWNDYGGAQWVQNNVLYNQSKVARAYHDCVTIQYKCSDCGQKGFVTFDFDDGGMNVRIGKYESYEKIENSMGVNIPMQHILQIYNGMDKSADDYDLANFNCQNFAQVFYLALH